MIVNLYTFNDEVFETCNNILQYISVPSETLYMGYGTRVSAW